MELRSFFGTIQNCLPPARHSDASPGNVTEGEIYIFELGMTNHVSATLTHGTVVIAAATRTGEVGVFLHTRQSKGMRFVW